MNLKEIEEIIFKSASSIMKKDGEDLFKAGLVSSVKGRKIETIYHIYGEVINPKNYSNIKTHIKMNLKHRILEDVRCTCQDFKEISKNKSLFMCQHLTGTAYKFLSLMENKKPNKERTSERLQEELNKEEKKKTSLGIDIKAIHKSYRGISSYELEFRLGLTHKHLITDLNNFIYRLDKGKSIHFNDSFTYNPEESNMNFEGIRIIDFIREYINENKNISLGRSLTISPKYLRKFLKCARDSKVIFKYSGIEYKTDVLDEDLPLSFTLKEENEYFKLTTHKKLPIPLNEEKDVYFFNNKLYLPSKDQTTRYIPLLDKFEKQGQILYKKTIENYNKIITLLDIISVDVTLSEDVKRFAASLLEFEFFLYKEKESTYCNVYALYSNEKTSLLDKSINDIGFLRDLNEEEKIFMKLERYKFIEKNDRLIFIGQDEDMFNLLYNKKGGIYSLGKVILSEDLKNLKLYDATSIKFDFYEEGNYFKLNYNIGDFDREELGNIFKSYRANSRFYRTNDKGFIDFQDEGIKEFFSLIQGLKFYEDLEEGSIRIEKNKVLFVLESLKNKDYKVGRGIELLENIRNKISKINTKKVTVPSDLKAELREYQTSGFKWFKILSELELGGILADEMGLGKTVQTIAFLLGEKKRKSLIVVPTSLIYNWQEEVARFAPSLRLGIAYGSIDNLEKILSMLEEYDMILTTYGTLRNNIEKFRNILFDYCIIDEAQNIKNPIAQVTAAVKEVRARLRFALTGTPIENNLTELWSIFDFIMPGYLYSKEAFDKKFNSNNSSDLENLKLMIKPFILRRTKKQVINDLPDKIEKKILVEMTAVQKAVYSAYIKKIREKIENNTKGKIEIFSYLTKLRQICLDPSITVKGYRGGSGKLKVTMALLEENIASQGKTLLFSQFTSALKKIGVSLREKGIEYFYLDGSTESKERIRLVNEFNRSDTVKVFLISLKAGGTGLNLTSANLVIHFDPWWNPAVENQATDRAHRIGQKNVVEVIKLVSKGTIEENIISLQEDKKELIQTLITGELKEGNALSKLSTEELVELFYQM